MLHLLKLINFCSTNIFEKGTFIIGDLTYLMSTLAKNLAHKRSIYNAHIHNKRKY